MNLEFKVAGFHCSMEKFKINGVDADEDDFGDSDDTNQSEAEPYGCGDRQFIRRDPSKEVLDKYDINEAEYMLVAGQLEAGLSFGNCGLCA